MTQQRHSIIAERQRYISYIRVSTEKQARRIKGESADQARGLGLAAQRDAVARFVRDADLVEEFVEIESGKKHTNRLQLDAALNACRKHRATLLIAKLDRLARNVHFISGLMEKGVKFIALDMPPDAEPFMIHIYASFAEREAKIISARTKAALAQLKARGVKLGSPNPLEALKLAWVAMRRLSVNKELLALIAERRSAGMSYASIASSLNGLRLTTPRGHKWYASTVRAALLRASAEERKEETAHPLYEDVALERNHQSTLTSFLPEVELPGIPHFSVPSAGRRTEIGGVPMPSNIQEAERMIDLFTSVGARSFVVTKTDVDQRVIWGKPYSVAELRPKLPAMVRTAADRKPYYTSEGKVVSAGENLIVRPTGPDVAFVQLDDLNVEQLERVRPAAFLMHETSPGNHQAWLAVSDAPNTGEPFKAFMRRVRKAVGGNDKSASHATRLSGTENFKPKFFPDYPVVKIIYGVPGRMMTQERLRGMGLLAAPEPVQEWLPPVRRAPACGRSWPDYARCLAGAPPNSSGNGADRSLADYTWCKFAAQRGWSIEEIAAELPNVSEKARERIANRDPGYVTKTAENGTAAAARGRQRSRA
jgi:DNA invertase Pin-like site-specific DNA recombinase